MTMKYVIILQLHCGDIIWIISLPSKHFRNNIKYIVREMMNDIFGIPDGNYQIIGFTIDVENRTFGYIFQGIRTHGSPNRPTAEYVLAFIELCKARGALSSS